MKSQDEESVPQQAPMASAKGDLRQLKENSGATVEELKAFLKELKGKSPQEMLGIVASSQLVRATCLSTVLIAVVAVICTAIPYAMGADKEKEDEVAEEKVAAPTAPKPAIPLPASTPTPATAPDQPTPAAPDLSKLGVGEEKKAPPNENPLENKKDNFLKGLE